MAMNSHSDEEARTVLCAIRRAPRLVLDEQAVFKVETGDGI